MRKKIYFSLIIAVITFLFILFISLARNPLSTTLRSSVYGFAVSFVIMFISNLFISTFLKKESTNNEEEVTSGSVIDFTTPEDELNHNTIQSEMNENKTQNDKDDQSKQNKNDFTPLHLPKLAKKEKEISERDLVNGVRQMLNE
ncbi:hypothetical protein [Longirhabdus pacifica]|uniref:hypothetical protein n=1 Tax=Longirhabdus pacifica TaxID=2305227 RepID=UPI00100870E5|nr:hypothetical protein [Longirhabdus pacifica]